MVFKQFDSFGWWFGVGGGGIGGGLGLGFRVGCWITVEFFFAVFGGLGVSWAIVCLWTRLLHQWRENCSAARALLVWC